MDARRLGWTASFLTAGFLYDAAPGYLTEDQRAQAPADWFTQALAYAQVRIKGVAAALDYIPDATGMGALPNVYRLADFLENYGTVTRGRTFPPDSFWSAARSNAPIPELKILANAARYTWRYKTAASLYRRAADFGDAEAMSSLQELQANARSYEVAKRSHENYPLSPDSELLTSLGFVFAAISGGGFERMARRKLVNTGDPHAFRLILQERRRAGDQEEVERLIRFGLNTDGSTADPWLDTD